MKHCPFCKSSISKSYETCPNCGRVLVEKIFSSKTSSSQTKVNQETFGYMDDFGKYVNKFIFLFRKNILLLIILALIGWAFSSSEGNKYKGNSISIIPNNVELSHQVSVTPAIQGKDPQLYTSLETGTILGGVLKKGYFKGFGELQIDNGSEFDAVAKLVSLSINKSVYTVYIKAHTVFTVDKISDGSYKLFFNLGNDWDNNKFIENNEYKVFEEDFDFVTTKLRDGKYIETKYTTFNITLNPVIQGKAQTDEVEPVEFANY